MQAYQEQVALVRMAQSQVEACEDELAARNAEIEAFQVHPFKSHHSSLSNANAAFMPRHSARSPDMTLRRQGPTFKLSALALLADAAHRSAAASLPGN